MPALSVLAHHSEPSDPVLLRWIIDTFESILGLGPTTVVVPVAAGMVAFPLLLALLAFRARRSQARRVDAEADVDERDGRLA